MSWNASTPVVDRDLTWFLSSPGTNTPSPECRICGATCLTHRNQYGPTSWAGSLAKLSKVHDRHECPHRHDGLHQAIVEYWHLMASLPEGRLKNLARLDLEDARARFQTHLAQRDR